MSWAGAFLVLGGRGLLAWDFFWWGFALACMGDGCWLVWGVRKRLWSLVFLDSVLFLTDVIGVVRH